MSAVCVPGKKIFLLVILFTWFYLVCGLNKWCEPKALILSFVLICVL